MNFRFSCLSPGLLNALALGVALTGTCFAQTGSIEGKVVDDKGAPLAGVIVSAAGRSAGAVGDSVVNSGADGSFALTGLAPGDYQVCVQSLTLDIVNPCLWFSGTTLPVTAKVGVGAKVQGITVQAKLGTKVEVRIDDDTKSLRNNEKNGSGVHLLLGVWTSNGLYYPAAAFSEDATGRNHSVIVPLGTPVKLGVSGRKLKMEDESGKPMKSDDPPIPFTVNAGENPKKFKFKIKSLE